MKCNDKLTNDSIAQVFGYYCKSKEKKDNQTGLAVTLNESEGNLEVGCFLFPYEDDKQDDYSIQSIMMLVYKINVITQNSSMGVSLNFYICSAYLQKSQYLN